MKPVVDMVARPAQKETAGSDRIDASAEGNKS
jgi:hypothetical protein